jgi:hypothetical protein
MLGLRCALVLAFLTVFVGLSAAAMALYPGGTYNDRTTAGHHFWHNFLCDLLHDPALGGGANRVGARLATVAMLAMVAAIALFFSLAPALLPSHPGLGRLVMAAGLTTAAGAVMVALTPSNVMPRLHTVAIVVATLPALVTATAATIGLALEPGTPPALAALGIVVLVAVAATSVTYAIHTFFGGHLVRVVPTLQRVAAVLSVVWLFVTTVRLLRGPS